METKNNNEKNEVINFFKIGLFGNYSVGKTSIINRYIYDKFDVQYIKTIYPEPSASKKIKIKPLKNNNFTTKDEILNVKIIDTVGQEKHSALCNVVARNIHACAFVFSIDNIVSFEQLSY